MSSRTLARPLFERLIAANTLKRLGPFVGLPAFAPELTKADEKILKNMLDEIQAGAFQPPFLDELTIAPQAGKKRLDRLATLAVALGELVEVSPKLYLHGEMEPQLRQRVAAAIQQHGEASVSEIRQALDSTRKYVVPFMEYLDRVGYTKRVGDKRVLAEATAKS